jgi:hypothetical protein
MGNICNEDRGRQQWITYECVGKGKEDVWTYEELQLRDSLEKAIKKMGITIPEINQVSYQYISLDINKTVRELGIPNGGVISIKLKSSF